jgi:hypothetical protein
MEPERVAKKLKCLRCEHIWWSTLGRPPVRCARCQSPYWSSPRVRREGEGGKGGSDKK